MLPPERVFRLKWCNGLEAFSLLFLPRNGLRCAKMSTGSVTRKRVSMTAVRIPVEETVAHISQTAEALLAHGFCISDDLEWILTDGCLTLSFSEPTNGGRNPAQLGNHG